MASAILRGFVLGFAIALTPGPIFFLCLRRTLSSGWRVGLASGLGVATADTLYAFVAGAGIGLAAAFLAGAHRWIALGGGLALVLVGLRSVIRAPVEPASATPERRVGTAYAATLLLTLGNPATIAAFGAVFAGVGLAALPAPSMALVVAGVALGSLSWWLVLVALATLLRRRLDARSARWLALVSGLAIAGFGAGAVASVLR